MAVEGKAGVPSEGLIVNQDSLFDAALDALAEGQPGVAADLFEQVLRAEPGRVEASHGLIRALEDAGRMDEALALAQRLVVAEPEDVLALTRLSMIFQHKGMIAEAESTATRAKILGWKEQLRSGIAPRTEL